MDKNKTHKFQNTGEDKSPQNNNIKRKIQTTISKPESEKVETKQKKYYENKYKWLSLQLKHSDMKTVS